MTRFPLLIMIIAAVACSLPAAGAAAQVAGVQELQKRIAELQQARRELEAARDTHRQQVAEVQRQLEQLRGDRERVQPLAEQQQREVDRLTAERGAATSKADEIRRQLVAIANAAQFSSAAMHGHVERGIPFEQPARTQALASIRGQLASDDPLSQAGGLEALASFAGEELQLMRGSDVWNAPLMLDDGKRRADGYHARLGLVSLYFVSEDAQAIGMTSGGKWSFDLDPRQRQSVVRLLRMLQGQTPPAIMNVPRGISLVPAPGNMEAAR